jgi:hypothetical protein
MMAHAFTRSGILASWMLAAACALGSRPAPGQTRPDSRLHDLAIKTMAELGGHLRYADEFTSHEPVYSFYPYVNPLDPYVSITVPVATEASPDWVSAT